jgi:hypothetical protein
MKSQSRIIVTQIKPNMKTLKFTPKVAILLVIPILMLSSCTSMTVIQSVPSGAKVYLNDEIGGQTPFTLSDNKIIGTTYNVRLEMEGYKPFYTVITRSEEFDAGPVVAGLLFTPVWWLWAMKYKPVHTYEMEPAER